MKQATRRMSLMNKRKDDILGEVAYDYGWVKKEKINVWGRELELDIIVSCFSNEDITDSQRETYIWFKNNINEIFEKAKLHLVQYCIQKNAVELANTDFSNMFKYVKPKSMLFSQDSAHNKKMAILFNYKFDKENGIAVIFQNGDVKKTGMQDIAL